jgi:hypothetical protein
MASFGILRAAIGAARSRDSLLLHLRRTRAATAVTVPRHLVASSAAWHAPSKGPNPVPGAAPLPEDSPPQTPPRLGEPDPVGPPTPTPKEKITGTPPSEEDGGLPGGGMPETTPPPDVPLPPVSPPDDGRIV